MSKSLHICHPSIWFQLISYLECFHIKPVLFVVVKSLQFASLIALVQLIYSSYKQSSKGRGAGGETHKKNLYNMENSIVANFLCNCYEMLESAE